MSYNGSDADKLEIRELIETYGDAVILQDPVQWASTWAEDAVWTIGSDEFVGKAAILSAWTAAMARFSFAALVATPGVIEIDGDQASLRVHVQESLVQKDGPFLRVWGRYDDQLTKASGRWLFRSRKYTVLHHV